MSASRNLPPIRPRGSVSYTAILVALLSVACGQVQHSENGIVFARWYIVKPAVDRDITTAYGQIGNVHSEPAVLSTVSLDCAETVELHETVEAEGRVSMKGLNNITIAAGTTIVFQPGSKHLMVSGFKSPLSGKCQATFTVAGRPIIFAIPVKERTH